jgi:hypothetical protein
MHVDTTTGSPRSRGPYDLAHAYVSEVQAMLDLPGRAATRSPISADDLATQAAELIPLSNDLAAVIASDLASRAAGVREAAAARLLAKAVTDLECSIYLLAAAEAEREAGETRSSAPMPAPYLGRQELSDVLNIVAGTTPWNLPSPTRTGRSLPLDRTGAEVQLSTAVEAALHGIAGRAVHSAQSALGGIIELGFDHVAGALAPNIAAVLDHSEATTRLFGLFRQYALAAYNSLAALLGPALLQMATNQAVSWVRQLSRGQQFADLLERLYETTQTRRHLSSLIAASPAGVDQFAAAAESVSTLTSGFQQQMALVDKLLLGLQMLSVLPVSSLPEVRVFLTALFLATSAYVVLAGADYLDAQHIRWLQRVLGVRRVVERHLVA